MYVPCFSAEFLTFLHLFVEQEGLDKKSLAKAAEHLAEVGGSQDGELSAQNLRAAFCPQLEAE